MLKTKLLSASAAVQPVFIEDVFSTYLFTGTGTTATALVTGIDLAGEGGAIFSKRRSSSHDWGVVDTERGVERHIETNNTSAEQLTSGQGVISFNNNGHTILRNTSVADPINGFAGTDTYVHWTFRKAPRFFDVVTYTGTGANRTVAHNLGVVPGCIIIKETSAVRNWYVYHRSTGNTKYLNLNLTDAAATSSLAFNNTDPTATEFTVGTINGINNSGATYVAYLFAHDPLGPSGDGSDGLIACGSFTQPSSGNAVVNLGWEPQWLLCKRTDSTSAWFLADIMRGATNSSSYSNVLYPNYSDAENPAALVAFPTASGFEFYSSPNATYIYIAIRRGPMREPTSGTEVFAVETKGTLGAPAYNSGFPVDMLLVRNNKNTTFSTQAWDRLRSTHSLTDSTAAEEAFSSSYLDYFDHNDGFDVAGGPDSNDIAWMFRRAPGFFDVVAYTGTGNTGDIIDGYYTQTLGHNLGAVPELVIIKNRGNGTTNSYWPVSAPVGTGYLRLNATDAYSSFSGFFSNKVYWTDTTWNVQGAGTANNAAGNTYIAYLFATLPGVSKVGSYTGNGGTQTINCGFTGGARFVLIKRTDSTGDWYVWDTARGIVAGNDPHLSLNTTAAEVTTNDSIDPDSSGFIVNQLAATNINVSSATYIYLAIA